MGSGCITSWEIDEETVETVSDFILGGSKITADGDCSHEIKRHLLLGRKVMTNLDSILKSRDISLQQRSIYSRLWFFQWSRMDARVELWRSWAPKNGCFWTVVLEKTLESPLDCKEIQPVHSERDQPWDFFGGNDAEAETPVLWPPHAKNWLIGRDPDARRGWGQEEKGTTEDEMAGWHRRLDGHEFEWTLGVDDGQGGLPCYNSWGCRVKHDWVTELNWTEHGRAHQNKTQFPHQSVSPIKKLL